jgi:4-amino-4-deoxy-L-arabinose transferase-like glycosyltransferase
MTHRGLPLPAWPASGNTTLFVILLIGVLALTVRLIFVSEVIFQNTSQGIRSFNPDSSGYLHLAHNLVYEGSYALPEPWWSRDMALARTPGYPTFCALFEWIGWSPSGILFAHALIGTSIPIATVLLVNAMTRSKLASFVAGLASALSPTGIGLVGILLADLLFAAAFVVSFLLLYHGIAGSRRWLSYGAGVGFGIAALIKPTLLFWPILSALVWFLLAKAAHQQVQWKHVCIFVFLQLTFLVAWSTRNYVVENSFTLSTIGSQNLRHYVAPRVEEWARAGRFPSGKAIKHNREIVRSRDRADLVTKSASPARIAQRQLVESFAIFQKHPWTTMRVYYQNVKEGATTGWHYFPVQLPRESTLRIQLKYLGRFAKTFQKVGWVLIGFALIGLFRLRRLRNNNWQRRYFATLALIITVAYFAALSGTTYWTGSRIMYPSEFAVISLSLVGLVSWVRDAKSLLWITPH